MNKPKLTPFLFDRNVLKYLYSYLSIFNIDLKNLTQDEASKFITFLVGQSQIGKNYSLEFKAIRSASSVNDYLSLIRNYIKYLSLKKHPLLNESGERKIQNIAANNTYTLPSFNFRVKEYHRNEVPKHITLDEYKRMLKYTYDTENTCLMCIIRLMYESGLRVGEVLGLTFEDIVQFSNEQGTTYYKVILRNRISDKSWQSAKFLMKPKTKMDYQSRSYSTKGFGYNEMYISENLYECLLEYIEEAHSEAQDNHLKQWEKYAVTDSVDETFEEENNFYVFLNTIGRPLSNVTLNQDIKDLFTACDVRLNDDGGKRDGLCHRFRHGFAMYQVNYNHVPMLLLKELMRHRNIQSTSVYYTPEISTIINIKNDLSKSVYELIPEFSTALED